MTMKEWTEQRVEILAEEKSSLAFMRGYLDAAGGTPVDFDLYLGEPLEADDYHRGYGLAKYECGPVQSTITHDGRVLSWVA